MISNFKFQISNYIKRLQSLPDKQKKIILWVVVGVLAVIMGYFWIKSAANRLGEIGNEMGKIELPQIETVSEE